MDEFNAEQSKWIKFADSIDYVNLVNRDNQYAKEKGLINGAIAPGMYLVSYIQNFVDKIETIKIRLRKPVYAGSLLKIHQQGGQFLMKDSAESTVCQIKINPRNFEEIQDVQNFDHVYKTQINLSKLDEALRSLEIDTRKINEIRSGSVPLPWMFLLSKSAPALKEWFGERNGLHVSQSARIKKDYRFGCLEIGIVKSWETSRFQCANLYWVQKDEVVACGSAKVRPLEF